MNRIVKSVIVCGMMLGLSGGYGIVTAEEKKAAAPSKSVQPAAAKKQTRTMLDFRSELNLSEDQTRKIREHLNTMDKDLRVMRANLSLVNVDLQNLMEKDADIVEIKKKIRESFDIQASIRIVDLETARNINKLLSAEQIKKWKAIRSQARNQQAENQKK